MYKHIYLLNLFLLAIAEALGSKVCVSQDKKAILDCLDSERISQLLTTDPRLASVHVLPMGRLTIEVRQTGL